MLLILPQWFCSEEMPPSSTTLSQQQLGAFDTSVDRDIAAKDGYTRHAPRAECQKPQEPDRRLRCTQILARQRKTRSGDDSSVAM